MQNEKRGVLSTVEVYIDMLINLASIVTAYLFVVMIRWDDGISVDITDSLAIIIIFANILAASLVYHILNLYKPSRYQRHFRSFPVVFKVNFIYFGALAVITAFVARAGYKQMILTWILFAAFLSTVFLTFKRHIIRLISETLRDKKYHMRKVIIIGDNTTTAADYDNVSHSI